MILKKLLGLALAASLIVPFAACDDTTSVEPPPPPAQIKTVRHYVKTFDNSGNQTGLQNNDVYSIRVTSDQKIWIGNQEGVAVFEGTSTTRADAYDQNNGLPNPKVRTMLEYDGKLYVGTWGGGIGVYDLALGTWETLDESDGLVNDLVSDIELDDDALIIATNGGVSRYVPATGAFSSFKRVGESTQGDLLDEFVSAVAVAQTPRGKEYWYMPKFESGIDPGKEQYHGITITRGDFRASQRVDTLQAFADNTLIEDPNGALSNGAGEYFFAGVGADGKRRRGVIKFDVAAALPSDATVLSARLRLRNSSQSFSLARVELHKVLSDWGEGTSDATGSEVAGAPAATGDATWLHTFYPNSFWNTEGGDFVEDASGTYIEVRGTGNYSIIRSQMADDAQSWIKNPSTNFGWVVYNPDSLKRFSSRENATPANRPTLELTHARFVYLTTVNSALAAPNVNDVYYDEANDLFWIAFATQGLATVDYSSSKWTYYTTDDGLPSNVIYSIAVVQGQLWVATQEGVARQLGDGTFRGYARSGGIPGDRVRRVYTNDPNNDQELWLGLVDAGAALVNPSTAE